MRAASHQRGCWTRQRPRRGFARPRIRVRGLARSRCARRSGGGARGGFRARGRAATMYVGTRRVGSPHAAGRLAGPARRGVGADRGSGGSLPRASLRTPAAAHAARPASHKSAGRGPAYGTAARGPVAVLPDMCRSGSRPTATQRNWPDGAISGGGVRWTAGGRRRRAVL
jgi:hypothetical protein